MKKKTLFYIPLLLLFTFKGIGASLMMASLQASLRGKTLHFKDDLAGLPAQMNSLLYEASFDYCKSHLIFAFVRQRL